MSTAWVKSSTLNVPSALRNFNRLSEARLQAESSIDMYSEHGFDAVIGPVFGSVCHLLIVVSYWTPGSAHCQAASAIWSINSRALRVLIGVPSVRAVSAQSSSLATACMNSSVTRTELLAFWNWTEENASESRRRSKSAAFSAAAFFSSSALHQMNFSMSGWSTSSTTILAARRVPPPDLIAPAHESAPLMKLTGPEAMPPLESGSIEPRIFERLIPEPEPPLKMIPSLVFQERMESMSSSTERMKHAEACSEPGSFQPTLNQTGELKAAFWLTRIEVSSSSKASPSWSEAK